MTICCGTSVADDDDDDAEREMMAVRAKKRVGVTPNLASIQFKFHLSRGDFCRDCLRLLLCTSRL